MCILCVIQKWSRRVATLLPWLVIPLIGFWALSQLLPPAFRFEITSPKLACVFVLLVTLFWYEVLMPQLSAWRERRNALLRERKRFEAIKLEKLRKTATRRCRNCSTPYRDQNPGGGKFMCSYCGHVSKRPVLDLPVPPSLEGSNSGLMKDLVGKGGKMLNGKAWSENGWICSQDWLDNENWVNGSVAVTSSYWRKNRIGLFREDENCFTEKSNSWVVIFACRLLTSFFLSIRWIWRKIFRVSSSKEVNSSDIEHRGLMAKRDENGANCHESRGEKARRKAEEKRQARLEKELEEEEERKQREEVARLVEERRKLRDEKIEAERNRNKSLPPARDNKKELEKKHQDRRKDKDKGSSKSNSDAEELDRKASKESERERDFEKKSETECREHQKSGIENVKGQNGELGNGMKNGPSNNFSRGNAGTRYLDRMRGTFLSSSRAFTGSGFFGRTASSTATFLKDNKFSNPVDQNYSSAFRRDISPPERVAGKFNISGDDKNLSHSVPLEPQPTVAPKKSWQQLFTGSASSPPSSSNVISRPNSKLQADGPSPHFPGQSSAVPFFDNPINFGLPSPFIFLSYPNVSTSSSLGISPLIEPKFPHVTDGRREIIPEEPELYEDPYISDPISLLGPVSESLDNFQLDLGTGCSSDLRYDEPSPDLRYDEPYSLKNISGSPEVNKPSPIESPICRIRIGDGRPNKSSWFPDTTEAPDMHTLPVEDAHVSGKGTWQMWNSSPLGQDGLSLVGGPGSWLLPKEQNKSTEEDTVQPSSQKSMASLFLRDDQVLSGTQTPPKVFVSNGQNGGAFSPVAGSNMNEPWLQKALYPPLTGSDSNFSLKAREETSQNGMTYRSFNGAVTNHSFDRSQVNSWSKKEQSLQRSREFVGRSSVRRPNMEVHSPLQMYSHFGHFIDN